MGSSASFETSSLNGDRGGGVMTLRLGHDVALVGVARRAVARWLRERGCRATDDAVLVVSELVTNAIVHAGAGCTIDARHGDGRLRVEVRDRSPRAPVIRLSRPWEVGGRGLHVVAAVAEAWGWEPTVDGKCVWAVVPAAVAHGDGDHGPDPPSA